MRQESIYFKSEMLPVCSTSSSSQIFSNAGIRPLSPQGKAAGIRGISGNRFGEVIRDPVHSRQVSFQAQATKYLYPHAISRPGIEQLFSNKWNDSKPTALGTDVKYVESACIMSPENNLLPISDKIGYTTNLFSDLTVDAQNNSTSLSDSLPVDSLSNLKTTADNLLSLDASVAKGDLLVKNTLDAITSPLTDTIQTASEAIHNAVKGLSSNADTSLELAGNRLTGFSVDVKDSMSKVGGVSIDVLRRAIVILEDYLATGVSLILYYYASAKELFPPQVRGVLNSTEIKAIQILSPLGAAFREVYSAIEALETYLGLDPNDPILPFFFFLGTSATLGIFYWRLKYGGYSGDLSPQSTLDLLTGEKNVALIDIRPEDLREKDGVPDLRRGARVKYASINLPEIDDSVRKLIKRERDLYDTVTAAVIRNLKIVQDRSKVIVLDADGTRSKGIARSLRKIGVKRTYMVKGGFQSWVKNGLRIKELKPETTFTILNEDAEAILEDIRPTPLQLVGYVAGFVAASYALLEWEKALQYVAIIGLGQTIYRRIAAYEDSEDFKQDVRLLMGPFRVGATAFSWAAGKLEPNRIGLPTSPSSSDVRSRVLQAAAKHESQPSDDEESQELSQELSITASKNEDPSES